MMQNQPQNYHPNLKKKVTATMATTSITKKAIKYKEI
jgi:hypothetical protein